jgi:hypothetical protein
MDAAPVDAGGDGGQLQRLMRMDPRTMSPDQLRELIESCGLTHADCVAKSQLQERAREALDYHRGGGAGSNTATDAAVAADDDQAPDPPAWSPVEPSELSALPAAVAAPPGRLPPVTPPPGRTTSSVDGTPGDSHGEAEV